MKRIQRKRTKGWKMPPNAKYVGRPSPWGDPYNLNEFGGDRDFLLKTYKLYLIFKLQKDPHFLDELMKYDYLACYCPLDKPCHADIIIELLEEMETGISIIMI